MQQHPATGPGTSPQIAHLAGGFMGAAVHVPCRNVEPGFWGRFDRGNVGGVRTPAERSATKFPTLDFRGT